MRALNREYLLKGVFLGLLLYGAYRAGEGAEPGWDIVARVTCSLAAGLMLALFAAAALKFREGYRIQGRPVAFLLFLLLESPDLIYAGLVLGALAAAFLVRPEGDSLLLWSIVCGAALGAIVGLVTDLTRLLRLGVGLLLAAGIVTGLLYWFGEMEHFRPAMALPLRQPAFFSLQLLLGMPFFYLLTFAGREEESLGF